MHLRILFVIDDTSFFLPKYLDEVVKSLGKDTIVGLTPVRVVSQGTIYTYIKRNLWRIGIWQFMKLCFAFAEIILGKYLFKFKLSKRPYTVMQVAQKYSIPIIETRSVNDEKYISLLKKKRIDVIVSSCSAIFKKNLLGLPKYGCINRHSALLPSYGGLLPVFQALIHKERRIGVTIHYMVEKIDKGKIIAQEEVKISPKSTLFSLYKDSYAASVPATIKAIEYVSKRTVQKRLYKTKESYYTFPTSADWETFFALGFKFI